MVTAAMRAANVLRNRQQRAQSPIARQLVGAGPDLRCKVDPVFDQCLRQLPKQVRYEQDDDAVEQPTDKYGAGVVAGEGRRPDPPYVSEPGDGSGNDRRSGPTYDQHIRDDTRGSAAHRLASDSLCERTNGAHGSRQDECENAEPEDTEQAGDPDEPERYEQQGEQRSLHKRGNRAAVP